MKTLSKPGKLRVARCPKDIGRGYIIWDGFALEHDLSIYASREDATAALTGPAAHNESRSALTGDNS